MMHRVNGYCANAPSEGHKKEHLSKKVCNEPQVREGKHPDWKQMCQLIEDYKASA